MVSEAKTRAVPEDSISTVHLNIYLGVRLLGWEL